MGNQQLRGNDAVEQAQVIQWSDFSEGIILPISSRLVFPLLGIMPFNKQVNVLAIIYTIWEVSFLLQIFVRFRLPIVQEMN